MYLSHTVRLYVLLYQFVFVNLNTKYLINFFIDNSHTHPCCNTSQMFLIDTTLENSILKISLAELHTVPQQIYRDIHNYGYDYS